ncbi:MULTISPECIES: hypothetical protein [Pseudomonas]|uniref:DNA polymerase III subunit chi n=1 Tax=Pseudomonas luteola TaxID=47886 RepID=A0A2X2EAU2_PSELU|nr:MULTISPECIES: hypothetical protein [Pseudomonas]ENA36951.1 hypothetical protein HMPREF1487_05132 [Pseudomonas sp. HPB0071]MBA1247231.1 hypothetical protein [Pseudomonas zeshuii]MBF8640298.1 DNA polymerase III subunit chi [Pseudomonas zeshuii]MBH3437771.1 DNA polymerase III subunit chi [Pseudomonas luteola]MBW5414216.1 hypothetical protein [Pseudomonas sp. MAG002Y]
MDKDLPPRPAHLMNDLESIRQLLDKHDLPMLTDRLDQDGIPVLSDVVVPSIERLSAIPPLLDQIEPERVSRQDEESLEELLRQEARLILQEVIAEFAPKVEAELQKRLDARLDELIRQREQV